MCISLYLVLYNFTVCVVLCIHHTVKILDRSNTTKIPCVFLFKPLPSFSCPSSQPLETTNLPSNTITSKTKIVLFQECYTNISDLAAMKSQILRNMVRGSLDIKLLYKNEKIRSSQRPGQYRWGESEGNLQDSTHGGPEKLACYQAWNG